MSASDRPCSVLVRGPAPVKGVPGRSMLCLYGIRLLHGGRCRPFWARIKGPVVSFVRVRPA